MALTYGLAAGLLESAVAARLPGSARGAEGDLEGGPQAGLGTRGGAGDQAGIRKAAARHAGWAGRFHGVGRGFRKGDVWAGRWLSTRASSAGRAGWAPRREVQRCRPGGRARGAVLRTGREVQQERCARPSQPFFLADAGLSEFLPASTRSHDCSSSSFLAGPSRPSS